MPVLALSPAQALEMHTAGALILDVREPWEVQIAGIDTALNIPMQNIPAVLKTLQQDQNILCLCHHGIRSMGVAHYLLAAGFDKVYNITGGIDAWSRTVDPSIARY